MMRNSHHDDDVGLATLGRGHCNGSPHMQQLNDDADEGWLWTKCVLLLSRCYYDVVMNKIE